MIYIAYMGFFLYLCRMNLEFRLQILDFNSLVTY